MRINVYEEELTDEVEVVWVEPRPGVRYCGVRLLLESSDKLHHREGDDDRSAVTIWLGTATKAARYFSNVSAEVFRQTIPALANKDAPK